MASETDAATTLQPIVSLPIVGDTTIEDAAFYVAVGAVTAFGWVSWPTAGLIGSLHALHQRVRNVPRTDAVGEVRQGLLEAIDEAI